MRTKDQELEQFDEFIRSTEEGGYLRGMFGSPHLRGWIADQIRSDLATSFIAELQTRDNLITSLEQQVSDLGVELKREERTNADLKDALARRNKAIDSLRKDHENQINKFSARISELEAREHEAQVKLLKLTRALEVLGTALRGEFESL